MRPENPTDKDRRKIQHPFWQGMARISSIPFGKEWNKAASLLARMLLIIMYVLLAEPRPSELQMQ